MNNVKLIVTGLSRYSFNDETTGRLVQGCSVHYVDPQNQSGSDTMGYLPGKANCDYSVFDRLAKLEFPHICDAIVAINFTSKNKSFRITDFIPLEKLEVLSDLVVAR